MIQILLILLGTVALVGGLFSWTYLSRIRTLEARVERLLSQASANSSEGLTPDIEYGTAGVDRRDQPEVSTVSQERVATTIAPDHTEDIPGPKSEPLSRKLERHIKQFWMIWLGGLSVGLAGIFLVRYGIDRGLLGPGARVLLGVVTGLGLHGLAEWLRQSRGGAPALAALAGGASITLYAAILAALRLYELVSPGTTFFALAAVALCTMALSLVHGPVLAVIGLLGAYAVPILISDGSGAIVIAIIYASIITVAALLLTRYVYRTWFWLSVVAGALGWWLLSLGHPAADAARPLYLAVFAYSLVAIPGLNWFLLRSENTIPGERAALRVGALEFCPLQLAFVLIAIALAISIAHTGFSASALSLWAPLVFVSVFVGRANPVLFFVPWLSLLAQTIGWLLTGLQYTDSSFQLGLPEPAVYSFPEYAFASSVLYSGLCWFTGREQRFDRARDSLMVLAPVCWIGLAYLLAPSEYLLPQWSVASAVLGVAYIGLSQSRWIDRTSELLVWLITAAHFAYSLAVVILLREASLTLALSLQVISLAWFISHYKLRRLDWLVKLVLAVILFRLTFNPWLLRYPVDIHWSLWTYGGATLSVFIASRVVPAGHILKRWLTAASMQLLVLFLAAEVRYQLYDGEIFRREYSLTEAAINSSLWAGLGLAYHLRSSAAASLRPVYQMASLLLLVLAFLNQVGVLLFLNPLWGVEQVGSTPVFNVILLAYGLPAVMAYLVYRFGVPDYRKAASLMAALSLFVFVSLEIRHLWQGTVERHLPTSDGELYSYSVVWLVMALAAMVSGVRGARRDVYFGGMTLLLIVVAKIFLVDTSGLEGLWRVASFMGLGLSLLGMAYVYQRVGGSSDG